MPPGAAQPTLAPTRRLDFELELGVFIGTGNAIGHPIALDDAESHVFGLTLFNDWSARDVQAWEYQPLGPFLSKNFASTVSPWIVTMEALAPFRRPFVRAEGDPAPLPYLDGAAHRAGGAIDVALEVLLQTPRMREAGLPAQRISRSNFADAAYWSVAQMVAHHTVNGCALAGGDLFGTGTLSGPQPDQAGSLLELTQGGKQPITLANGEQRTFIEDGDSLSLLGRCSRSGFRSIGFGPCEATVLPTAR
jgi:fumarylacetoacetase